LFALKTAGGRNLLKNPNATDEKTPIYQVLLLENDDSDDVSVQEAETVDFLRVKEHLKNGGSVFITSKAAQKSTYPKTVGQQNYCKSRRSIGVLFRQQTRATARDVHPC
jgi:hypothetical protein